MPKPVRSLVERGVRYQAAHFSVPLLIICLIMEIGALIGMVFFDPTLSRALFGLGVLILWGSFYIVRVIVDQDGCLVTYGIGLFQRALDVATVESVKVVPNRFLASWIYTPLESHALAVFMRGGGKIIIPSDNPRALAMALNIKA